MPPTFLKKKKKKKKKYYKISIKRLRIETLVYHSSFSMSSPSGNVAFAVVGTVVDSLPDWSLRIYQNCLLAVDQEGSIVFRDETTKQNLDMIKEK